MSRSRFKVGDRVVDLDFIGDNQYYKGLFEVVEIDEYGEMFVEFVGDESNFQASRLLDIDESLVLESVYNSELYKLMHKKKDN